MIALVPTVALAMLSFLSSMFVLLRLLLPILPPGPLSRRVPPSEFGLPNYGTLSAADKAHVYLAGFDLLALGAFIWQVVVEQSAPVPYNAAYEMGGSTRLWFACTARQTCLAIVLVLAVIKIRRAQPVTFGPKHVLLVVPTLVVVVASSTVAAICAKLQLFSLFNGLAVYGISLAILSSAAFSSLVWTLVSIRRNMAAIDDAPWPPVKEKKRRGSFATEDVEAIKEGSSWITSHRSSRHNSVSSFAFSARSALPSSHNSSTRNHFAASANSILPKSSYWFSTPTTTDLTNVPPVPPLPEQYQYRPPSPAPSADEHDPFRRDDPPRFPRSPKSSQNSWLTSPSVSQATMTDFSFPTTRPTSPPRSPGASSRDLLPASATTLNLTPAPALAKTKVLGGYGYVQPSAMEKGGAAGDLISPLDAPVSAWRIVGWLALTWIPVMLATPYFVGSSIHETNILGAVSVLLILSVTLSSPLLALNLVLSSPVPIPTGLFASRERANSVPFLLPPTPVSANPYGSRANSPTVIEGRRSGDIWLARGDAVDGRSKAARVLGVVIPRVPKLSVLPPQGQFSSGPPTPELPMQTREMSMSLEASEGSGFVVDNAGSFSQVDPHRLGSHGSSYLAAANASVKHASRIVIAERHRSALATTLTLQPSPEKMDGKRASIVHSRSQSESSITHRFPSSPSPPPTSSLPPTPPRLPYPHGRASSQYSFSPVSNAAQIDSLSAGMLPLLVPGLKVGKDVQFSVEWEGGVAGPTCARPRLVAQKQVSPAIGYSTSFSSPENHSTPPVRPRHSSRSKSHHYSLPSLGLGKGIDFIDEVQGALMTPESRRRKTLCDAELSSMLPSSRCLNLVHTRAPSATPDFVTAHESMHHRLTSTGTPGQLVPAPPAVAVAVVTPSSDDPFLTPTSDVFPADTGSVRSLGQEKAQPAAARRPRAFHLPTTSRPSSIVYVKTDEPARSVVLRSAQNTVPSAALTHGAVKRTESSGSDKLRPLVLLQDRDVNSPVMTHPSAKGDLSNAMRPLNVLKKSRKNDENASPNLKTLRLVRTATAKARARWLENDNLPAVVVRPPSNASTITVHPPPHQRF